MLHYVIVNFILSMCERNYEVYYVVNVSCCLVVGKKKNVLFFLRPIRKGVRKYCAVKSFRCKIFKSLIIIGSTNEHFIAINQSQIM